VQKTAHQTDIAVCYNLLASIAKEKGDFKNALKYYQLSNAINDSISNVVKTKAVVELEKKYNQAKNENLIKDLGKKQQLFLLLAIAGLFAAIAIGFFLRQQSLKHKKDILETEQRLNRARINPHFFFNTLTTLQKIALSESDKHNLASQLSKFSNIMRETLESTYKDYITIEEEIKFLQQYFDLQKIRFPNSFNVDFIIPQDLEIDEVLLPAMILQPFVENSIEHGFAGIDYPGNITIKFITDHANLLVEIVDNGNGLNTNIKGDHDHISRASQIIKDRLYLLNLKLKTKAGFNINNVESGGVLVKINLPLLYNESI
jgi:LytS/YehU family sensor histidine kinase